MPDGNLYAGVHVDFMGTDPAIFRTLGDRPAVRTEQYDSRWLNGKMFKWMYFKSKNKHGYQV